MSNCECYLFIKFYAKTYFKAIYYNCKQEVIKSPHRFRLFKKILD